jgi:hypothetical protein
MTLKEEHQRLQDLGVVFHSEPAMMGKITINDYKYSYLFQLY